MSPDRIELWGGFECTIVRIKDAFRNQTHETGHDRRLDDLAAVRALGIETLRYPVLWESVAPKSPDECDWRWSDERLATMRFLGLKPIVGLLHHGSGPCYTSLVDPAMPDRLADYARKVVTRYPWVDRFTPVNEPVTTARFSTLYGHWYPHGTDFRGFIQAVFIQCKATLLAMRAIRSVNPGARLVQTEDIGKSFCSPALGNQAELENDRRWLSLDLLCGKVDAAHPWYGIFEENGVSDADLALFRDGKGVPDVIGVNHYLTSERYLDENLGGYPRDLHGHNGDMAFADAEAVRVDLPQGDLGPAARLREVWDRYGRPMAVTEVHHGCTREEQLRWLAEVWNAAATLKNEGVDIKAVTMWSLMGAYDWNSLLTARNAFYEPGAFDIRAPSPRLTALGKAAASLAGTGAFSHPVLDAQGWWHRHDRFYRRHRASHDGAVARTVLILGQSRGLAGAFVRLCERRGLACTVVTGHEAAIRKALDAGGSTDPSRPWAVVNAAYDPCGERPGDRARGPARVVEPGVLARLCAARDLPLVTLSSDIVFDGHHGPYDEGAPVCPSDKRGRLAAAIEVEVATAHADSLIVRSGPLFSVWDDDVFGSRLHTRLRIEDASGPAGGLVSAAYVPDLVHAVLDLLVDGETGIWHLGNGGEIGLPDLVSLVAHGSVARSQTAGHTRPAPRNRALVSRKAWTLPTLADALDRFARDVEASRPANPPVAAE